MPAKNVSLVEQMDAPAQEPVTDLALIVERLAANPQVDVGKLEKIIELQERILNRNREAAFNVAFAEMQSEIPEITERGEILNKEGRVQSKYARNEDIQQVLRPILKQFGFSLSFRTEWPTEKRIKVIGILTHIEGHARESEFLSEADGSGNKNSVQALGSAISYGRRYTTLDLLNITSRGQDDDGQGVSQLKKPDAPKGYDDWMTDMAAAADEGWPKLSKAWNDSKLEFRNYTARHNNAAWERLKAKSQGAKS